MSPSVDWPPWSAGSGSGVVTSRKAAAMRFSVSAAITAPTERGDRMLSTMINRHALQMIDLDTLALIEAA